MSTFNNIIKNFIKINTKFLNILTETNVGVITLWCLSFYVYFAGVNKPKTDWTFFYYVCLIFVIYCIVFAFLLTVIGKIKTIRNFLGEDFSLKYLSTETKPPVSLIITNILLLVFAFYKIFYWL